MNELTTLELEIVRLLFNGYSKSEVVTQTTLTYRGVTDRLRSIKNKIGATSINGIKAAYSADLDRKKLPGS